MGLENVLKRIDEEASAEVASIMDAANKEADRIKNEKRKEVSKDLEEMSSRLEREIVLIRNIHISDGKRGKRQIIISAKEEMINETLSEVKRTLSSLDGLQLAEYLDLLYQKAKNIFGKGMAIYAVRKEDASILEGKDVVEGIIEGGKDLPSSISRFQGKDMLGGFFAITSDGRKVINMSFFGILEKEEQRIRELIAKSLFQ